ncbi:MFS transporter [Comamonas testosteroni]|uniref:MFS transporter n=1 Tax=Comamonas testosteroni TaxID=285 RepID=UPI00389986C2
MKSSTHLSQTSDRLDLTFSSTKSTPALSVPAGKRATRLSFFLAGFGLACWAPLVPYARARLGVGEAELGTILLFLGLGAVLGMPLSGALASRLGSRPLIFIGSIGLAVALPLLATVTDVYSLSASLFLFGASIGAIDVAANIHGTDVQEAASQPLMSGFHGLYSVGGLMGAFGMTMLIANGLTVVMASALCSLVILLSFAFAYSGFFDKPSGHDHPLLSIPRGVVITIGLAAMVIFLAEGALLDWGALLMTETKGVAVDVAGSGYVAFALAMTISRLIGDKLVARIGETAALYAGIFLTGVGILIVAASNGLVVALAGMALTGFAAGNVVPVLFTLAGRQNVMPAALAIAAASILGYLGVLLGPAVIGYVAHGLSLTGAFYLLAVVVFVMLCTVKSICSVR